LCCWKKKIKTKSLPIKPIKGGIPDIDNKIDIIVNVRKSNLEKIFKSLSALKFFWSNKNKILKKKQNKNRYINIFI